MNDTLRQCERDVELARSKLETDLAILRAPSTFSSFKEDLKNDALETKDALLEQAKQSAQSKVSEFVEDLKAKAAANPAAALAIGAGIAWQLIRRPPIATALVGAGLLSLLRTQGARRVDDRAYLEHGKQRLAEQASEFGVAARGVAADVAEMATEKASELADTARGKASELADTARYKASEFADTARDKASEFADTARDKASEFADTARDKASEYADAAKQRVRQWSQEATDQATLTAARVRRSVEDASTRAEARVSEIADTGARRYRETVASGQEFLSTPESRDTLLLGAAGIAVAAALGIALQKRMTEDATEPTR